MYKFKKNSGNACYTLLNFSEAASKIKKYVLQKIFLEMYTQKIVVTCKSLNKFKDKIYK